MVNKKMKDTYEEKLERRMKKERRYTGRSEYLGAFGLAGVFTFVGIVSIIFNLIALDFIGIRSWGYWMFIPAFFIWIGGISAYLKQKRLRAEVLSILDNYPPGPISIDTLTQEAMMERPSLMQLFLDLRVDRLIKFRIDSKSGDLILGESYIPPRRESAAVPSVPSEHMYCPHCGKEIARDSIFCANCGSSVQ